MLFIFSLITFVHIVKNVSTIQLIFIVFVMKPNHNSTIPNKICTVWRLLISYHLTEFWEWTRLELQLFSRWTIEISKLKFPSEILLLVYIRQSLQFLHSLFLFAQKIRHTTATRLHRIALGNTVVYWNSRRVMEFPRRHRRLRNRRMTVLSFCVILTERKKTYRRFRSRMYPRVTCIRTRVRLLTKFFTLTIAESRRPLTAAKTLKTKKNCLIIWRRWVVTVIVKITRIQKTKTVSLITAWSPNAQSGLLHALILCLARFASKGLVRWYLSKCQKKKKKSAHVHRKIFEELDCVYKVDWLFVILMQFVFSTKLMVF